MTITPNAPMPEWLVGPAATTLALAVFTATLLLSLALALVQMQTKLLNAKMREVLQWSQAKPLPQTFKVEPDNAVPLKRRKWRNRRTRIRKIMEFFIGGEDESEVVDGPFDLSDDSWLAPTLDGSGSVSTVYFMIGDSPKAGSSQGTQHKLNNDEFHLSDEYWLAPSTSMDV